ncbi:sensor histidine kinase [Novosphingobium percolationis]|uniref:sensor histidine kinase n=1 Tax=Novosphingobium percolationis TaxID=2871811 RepID=UPI001CD25346|nr:HAMP domain-containing sensor histidine kinase [Novosphingobium percolationis]
MPFAPAKALLRSTVFRLSLLNAALLVLAMAGAGIAGWLVSQNIVESDARERIALEVHAVAVEVAQESLVRAADAIGARSERPGALEYLLVDPHGRIVAGDLTTAPRAAGWHAMAAREGTPGLEGKEHLLVLTSHLPDGSLLVIGDDVERGEAVREAVFNAILVSGVIALIVGLAVGFVATRRVLRGMQDILGTVRAVEQGDLTARIPHTGRARDDLDELALAMNGMLDRIDTLVGTVRRVSAEIAHDLRTPLTRVRHTLEAAKRSHDVQELQQSIDDAGGGIDGALRLFESMLDLAEIDSGDARKEFAPVDLAAVAEQVVDAYRPEIEGSGRSIDLLVGSKVLVEGDIDLLTRAVANLVDNALKHSAMGARIVVRVAPAFFSVEDDGPGIAPDHVPTVLRPFGRLDAARTTPGNGLGLAIVEAVARLHGARMEISHLAPGLAVRLTFPAQ